MIDLKKNYKTSMGTEVKGLWIEEDDVFGWYINEAGSWTPQTWDKSDGRPYIEPGSAQQPGLKLMEIKERRRVEFDLIIYKNGTVMLNNYCLKSCGDPDLVIWARELVMIELEEGEGL